MKLRIVCTGRTKARHNLRELASIYWEPEFNGENYAVWSGDTPLKELQAHSPISTSRSIKGGKASRKVNHTPVETRERADGGTTWVIPPCPTCRRPETPLRDTTLRNYYEKTQNTPLQGTLDISHTHLLH